MRKIVELSVDEVAPSPTEVIESQGMTGRVLPERIRALLDSALELFGQLAEPRGIMEELPITDFPAVFDGNGLNAPEGPVRTIVPNADALALFAATLGSALIAKSSELFTKGGPALGFMLDAVNSSGAERMGKAMGQHFVRLLPDDQRRSEILKVQYYSPGYCGWHTSPHSPSF